MHPFRYIKQLFIIFKLYNDVKLIIQCKINNGNSYVKIIQKKYKNNQ